MDFIVKKRYWNRANENNLLGGSLRDKKGKMCCLGFVCQQLGFKPKELLNQGMPIDLFESFRSGEDKLTNHEKDVFRKLKGFVKKIKDGADDTKLSSEAAEINDNADTTDEIKIEALTKLFAKYGHTITFV